MTQNTKAIESQEAWDKTLNSEESKAALDKMADDAEKEFDLDNFGTKDK